MNNLSNSSTNLIIIAPKVVLASGIVAAICFVGILLNIALVYVTAKNKSTLGSLHGRCNLLIAFNSLVAIPTLYGISFKFFVLITGTNFIALRSCYIIIFVSLLGGPLMSTSLLCIGLDRLTSVLFPMWYKSSHKYRIFHILLALCFIRTIYRNLLYFYMVTLYSEKKVMCSPGDMNQAEIGAFIYQEGLFFYWVEFICYLAIWATILVRRKSFQNWETTKKLMISLSVIMAISLFGSIQAQVYRIILHAFPSDSLDTEYLVQLLSSCLYAISDSSNAPVLFILNHEYRTAFLHCFNFLKKLTSNNTVMPNNSFGQGQHGYGHSHPNNNRWVS